MGIVADEDFKRIQAELNIVVDACYEPLNNCSLYVPHTKPARHKLNDAYWSAIDPKKISLPVCERLFEHESVCLHHKILMGDKSDMDLIANAIEKIYHHVEDLM